MKLIRKILKLGLYLLAFPVAYLIASLVPTAITVNRIEGMADSEIVYLNTNGVHLDIVMQRKDINSELLKNLVYSENENYISFGWGDEDFYINTPTWGDLTFGNAFKAMFLKSPTLMHLTRYERKRSPWVEVMLSETELNNLNKYILESFKKDQNGDKMMLPGIGYSTNDNFYKANGSYSCLETCNTWVNTAFKESGLKACLWTPFDFGLMNKYE